MNPSEKEARSQRRIGPDGRIYYARDANWALIDPREDELPPTGKSSLSENRGGRSRRSSRRVDLSHEQT